VKDRLKKIRNDTNLNQTDFGSSIGATRSMIASYEGGAVVPDDSKRMLICSKYHVNPIWLETGEGEPYDTYTPDIAQEVRDILRGSDPFVVSVMTSLAQMPNEWWATFRDTLFSELDKQKKNGRG